MISPTHRTYLTIHNTQKRQTSMPPAEFEPTIPVSERPQTHALYSAATAIGRLSCTGKAVPYRPTKALRAPGGRGSQVCRQSAHEGGKVVSPTHRPPLPPRKDSRYSFLLEAESTPGP
jgi:hypothetical protein